MPCIFDQETDRTHLSSMKWEAEIERLQDPDLLCFGTADMDFRSADPILDAIRRVAEDGHLGYPKIRPSYYEAICNWLKRLSSWEIKKEGISTNVGIYPAAWAIIDALTEPGDEVIIQPPCHFCFTMVTEDSGRKAVPNPLIEQDGRYYMDYEGLEQCFTERTKIFWLCNPHQPVGRAWTKEELEKLAEICLKHNVTILSDDVYCGLLWPGADYIPMASLSHEVSMHTITCYSTSKTYNTTGDKHAFVVTENPEILSAYNTSIKKLNLNFGQNEIGLAVTEAAFNECDDWLHELNNYIHGNYLAMKEYLAKELPEARLIHSESTYFAWIDFSFLGFDDRESFVRFFEKEARVCVEPGPKFGEVGKGYIRFNLGCTRSMMIRGLDRIKNAYLKIK